MASVHTPRRHLTLEKAYTSLGERLLGVATKGASLAGIATPRRLNTLGNSQQRLGDVSPRRGYLNASLAWVPTPREHLRERDEFLLKNCLILKRNVPKIPKIGKNTRKIIKLKF